MANKKIWAYAMNVNNAYVVGEKHPLRIFYIWEVLKLKEKDIHEFNQLSFMSTHNDPTKRVPLSAVKTGFYRYPKGYTSSEVSSGDSDSLSHSIAIQVLSEMDEINFKISKNVEFKVSVENIRTDDLKIQLTNKDKFSYYYPDLICNFTSPSDLSMKWGGKLAIEVKHTHACEPEKITDFESHGIPIIEVSIDSISIEKMFKTKNPTADDLESYYNYLKRTFKKQVFGKILSDPISVSYYKLEVNKRDSKIKSQENKLLDSENSLQKSLTKNEILESKLSENEDILAREKSDYQNKLVERDNKILEIEDTLSRERSGYQNKLIERDNKIIEIEKRGFCFFLLKSIGLK
ncbi:hypothetical protein CWB77_05000 [Pseudoalteromonas sp. S1610]|uniref:hypothetical protein n=1 Tax=Pseudoalteromonas sp. S1610 TaxID=579506 RepID=UPI00110ACCD6|nr:hypothetical protein [Pseudoalteromonas sp. S1610]TMP62747.1 hypothetical protein CWB77_05000 [Pseudoalteromonas sp. S1610]